MFQVMIVDDEENNFRLLKNAVPWADYGFSVVATAEDGAEALEKFYEFRPDVVLVDIRMPIMDGLEFIRRLRQVSQDTVVLVISAYDDFKYAQTAISYGISGYILKPVNRKELVKTICHVREELEKSKKDNLKNLQLQNQMRNRQISSQLQKLVEESADMGSFTELGSLFSGSSVFYLAIVLDPSFSFDQLVCCREKLETYFWFKSGEESVALLKGEAQEELLEALKAHMRCRGGTMWVYMSSGIDSPEKIDGCFRELRKLIRTSFYRRACEVLRQDQGLPQLNGEIRELVPPAVIDQFVLSGSTEPLAHAVNLAFRKCAEQRVNPDLVREKCVYLLIQIKQALTRTYGNEAFHLMRHIDLSKINTFYRSAQLQEFLLEIIGAAGDEMKALQSKSSVSPAVGRAIRYTERYCYSADFTVSQVADYVNLSKNYFLTVFRQEMGQSFWDYVTILRMEKAKELLKETNKTMYEISLMVGYKSEYHFSRKFKQLIGVKASEFRKKYGTV